MIYKGFPLVSVKLIQNIRSKIQVSTFVYIKSCCIEVIYVRFRILYRQRTANKNRCHSFRKVTAAFFYFDYERT